MLILTPAHFSVATEPGPTALLDWVGSALGQQVAEHGQCAVSLLPRDDDVVLVLPPRAVSWHQLALPKVAAGKLRAVLDGMLEERLLGDTEQLHFALEPGGRPGRTVWVAACHKAWLQGWLRTLEAAGRPVTRIVPALAPLGQGTPQDAGPTDTPADVIHWAHMGAERPWLASASAHGVSCIPLRESATGGPNEPGPGAAGPDATTTGPGVPGLHPETPPAQARWMADPAVVALAEQALGQRFELVPLSSWLLRSSQTSWNLAQFDLSLSSSSRRQQRWLQSLRQWRSAPAWRPARWGLAALVAMQLIGLNATAWYERRSLDRKEQAVRQTLQQTFPKVTLVLDAPLQMQRELASLLQANGALSAGDLEALLGALAQSSTGAPIAPRSIEFTPGEARFAAWSAPEEQLRQLQQTLERNGWRAALDGDVLTLRAEPR